MKIHTLTVNKVGEERYSEFEIGGTSFDRAEWVRMFIWAANDAQVRILDLWQSRRELC